MYILEKTGLLNTKLLPNQEEPLSYPRRYRRLLGKLNYLIITRPDISFAIRVESRFINSPCEGHWNAVICIRKYIKEAPTKGCVYEDKFTLKIVWGLGSSTGLSEDVKEKEVQGSNLDKGEN